MHLKLTELGIVSYSPQLVGAFPSAWNIGGINGSW
jgi:hypothetical protein